MNEADASAPVLNGLADEIVDTNKVVSFAATVSSTATRSSVMWSGYSLVDGKERIDRKPKPLRKW